MEGLLGGWGGMCLGDRSRSGAPASKALRLLSKGRGGARSLSHKPPDGACNGLAPVGERPCPRTNIPGSGLSAVSDGLHVDLSLLISTVGTVVVQAGLFSLSLEFSASKVTRTHPKGREADSGTPGSKHLPCSLATTKPYCTSAAPSPALPLLLPLPYPPYQLPPTRAFRGPPLSALVWPSSCSSTLPSPPPTPH